MKSIIKYIFIRLCFWHFPNAKGTGATNAIIAGCGEFGR